MTNHKLWLAAAVTCSALALAGCSGGDTPAAAPSPSTSASEPAHHHDITVAPAATMAADDGVPRVGDTVQTGGLECTVTKVEQGVAKVDASDEFSIEAEGSYTIVDVTVKNIGHVPQRYFAEYVTGIASDGHEISSDMVATSYLNEGDDGWLAEIKPGDTVHTRVVFDVESGETLTAVVFREVATSTGATVAL